MYFDTHCHLNMMIPKEFDVPLQVSDFLLINDIINEAQQAGVMQIINVGTSLIESINSVNIAQCFKNVFATVGLHPCHSSSTWRDDFAGIVSLVKNKEYNKIVGIGEIGLDFYHKPFDRTIQEDAFKAQIELGLEYDLPFSIHVRDAADELLKVLEPYVGDIKQAVIHCFCQKKDFADVVIDWGFFVGIDAPITYPKNNEFRSIVAQIPLEHIVLETDAPFLPPQQFRGKQNRPSYIPLFAQTVADLKNVTLQECAQQTTLNAKKLFGL